MKNRSAKARVRTSQQESMRGKIVLGQMMRIFMNLLAENKKKVHSEIPALLSSPTRNSRNIYSPYALRVLVFLKIFS